MRGSEGRNIGAAAALLIALAASVARAQDEEPPRRDLPLREPAPSGAARAQEFSIGYRLNVSYPGHVDRENVASLSMAATDAVHLALQDSGDDPFYYRVPKWGAAYAIDTAVRYVSHEYGHLSSFSKAGYRQAIFGDKDKLQGSAPKASVGRMFLSGFNPFDHSAVTISQSDWDRIVRNFGNDPVLVNRFTVAVKAGGVNQEEVDLDRYSERLYDGRLSPLDTLPFVISGAAALRYPTRIEMSDMSDYIAGVKESGLRTSVGPVHTLSALTLLSGSSLAAFRGFFLGLATSRAGAVEPIRLSASDGVDIFAPEFDNFLSEFGPTFKSTIPVRALGCLLQPSFEQLFVGGASKSEGGLSVRAPLASFLALSGAGYFNRDGGRWLQGGVEILPLEWLSLTLGYAAGENYTFHRDVYGAGNDLLRRGERSLLVGLSAFHQF